MKLTITIDSKTYEVDVEPSEPEAPSPARYAMESAPVHLAAAAPPAPPKPVDSTPADESKVCRSPVTGIVVRVATQVGQSLQVGDVLFLLEAMKMETSVTSGVAGKVAAIKAAVGDSVQTGQALVEFE